VKHTQTTKLDIKDQNTMISYQQTTHLLKYLVLIVENAKEVVVS
jgi:hypothetical protein